MTGWLAASVGSGRSQADATGRPFLEALLDEAEELPGHHAVDDAMVEAQGHVHHVAHRDSIPDHHRAAHDRFGGQDRGLWLVDDRLARDRSRSAGVVERERAALDV